MATFPLIGLALSAVGLVWLLIVVFKEGGVVWGVVSLLMPPLALVFAVMNWGETVKSPVLVFAGGVAMLALGAALGLD